MAPPENPINCRQVAAFKGHVTRAITGCDLVLIDTPPASLARLTKANNQLDSTWTSYFKAFLQFEDLCQATGDEYTAATATLADTQPLYEACATRMDNKTALSSTSVISAADQVHAPKLRFP